MDVGTSTAAKLTSSTWRRVYIDFSFIQAESANSVSDFETFKVYLFWLLALALIPLSADTARTVVVPATGGSVTRSRSVCVVSRVLAELSLESLAHHRVRFILELYPCGRLSLISKMFLTPSLPVRGGDLASNRGGRKAGRLAKIRALQLATQRGPRRTAWAGGWWRLATRWTRDKKTIARRRRPVSRTTGWWQGSQQFLMRVAAWNLGVRSRGEVTR